MGVILVQVDRRKGWSQALGTRSPPRDSGGGGARPPLGPGCGPAVDAVLPKLMDDLGSDYDVAYRNVLSAVVVGMRAKACR